MRLPANPSPLQRYGLAVGVSVLALVISVIFFPLFERTPFLLFFPAIVLSAWFGGLGPGLLATVLALVLSDYFLLAPLNSLSADPTELAPLVVFAGVAAFISLLYAARERSERELAQRLSTLSAIYTLSDTVNRANSIEMIYEQALDALQRAVAADRASILLFDANGVMQFKAWRGLSDSYRATTTGHSPWTIETRDPQPVLVPDVAQDPNLENLRPVILGEGIRSLAFIPLVSGERLLGKFMVYYNSPHVFTPDQVQAAETIARHIAFALEQQTADEELRRSRRQLEIILHGITDGITVQEPSGKLIYANEAAARIIGVKTPEELIAMPVSQVMQKFQVLDETGQPFPLARLPGRLALQGQQSSEELVRFRIVETGEEHWSIVSAAPVFDAQGQVLFAINMFRDFTARRRAEDAERRQRELLQVTLTSIGDAVIATDVQARVTFMNRIAETLTGWSEADAQGQPLSQVFKIINEETRLPVESPAPRVITGGIIVGLANHTLLITKEGRELPIDDSGAPIRDAQGNVIGVVLAFRDVTEQRKAQVELARLAAIVESSEDAIHAKTLHAVITSWNRSAERLYGYTAREIIGQSAALLMPGDHLSELEENMAQIRNGQPIRAYETRRRHKNGSLIDVLVTISPVKNNEGKIVGASTIARDISERKRAEHERAHLYAAERQAREEAELAQQRLTVLAEASHILASSLDYETTLSNVARLVVPQFADWCSVHIVQEDGSTKQLAVAHIDPSKVEFIHELQHRFPPDPDAPRGVPNVIRTGQPEITPEITDALLTQLLADPELLRIVRALGLRSAMTLPLIARDRVVGAISFVTAESGRLYGASDLALAQDLARRAAAAIDNAQLYKQAEAAIRVRDQFLTFASHELKTPITSVMGFAELLHRRTPHATDLTERDRRALSLIYTESARLGQLINSMLDLSRIEAGQLNIQHNPVDLNALTARVVEAQQITLQRHTLSYSAPDSPVIISGDELRLEQVLQNLMQNAIKYSPQGGPVLVKLEPAAHGVALSVSDNGIGIPQDTIPRLFSRFFRADNAKAHQISGLGIGLFVVKQIVNLHGGRIEVASREGEGSTFTVHLPLEPAVLSAEHQ